MNETVLGYFEIAHIVDTPWRDFSASLPFLLFNSTKGPLSLDIRHTTGSEGPIAKTRFPLA